MKTLGSRLIAEMLNEAKMRFIFGIPGTHNIELYDAFLEFPDLHPTLITDEQSAGFLADGVWRSSGEIAVLNLVPGAGVTHSLSGITEAFLDQIPMLVLASDIRNDSGRSYQLHQIDQAAVLRPVTKKVFTPSTHQELSDQMQQAIQICKTPPFAPVAVLIPANLLIFPGEVNNASLPDVKPPAISPMIISQVADRLNKTARVGIYAGLGALEARESLLKLAEKLDAPVFTTISAKGLVPEDHALFCWNVLGKSSPPAFQEVAIEFDVLLAIGCRFSEVATGSYGYSTAPALIHVDLDADVFDRNYIAEIKVQSDAKIFCENLNKPGVLINRDKKSGQIVKTARQKIINETSASQTTKVSPDRLFQTVQKVFGPEAKYVVDSGNGLFTAMENLRLQNPRCFLSPTDYSCMGYCVPAAIGAKMASPGSHVVAFPGDGAFLMTGLELLTAVQQNIGVAIMVLWDGEYSQIKQFQEKTLVRTSLTDMFSYNLKGIADAIGVQHFVIQSNNELETVTQQILEAVQKNQTVLCEVHIDYSVPTFFTKGVLKTNFGRLATSDKLRLAGRLLKRKIF